VTGAAPMRGALMVMLVGGCATGPNARPRFLSGLLAREATDLVAQPIVTPEFTTSVAARRPPKVTTTAGVTTAITIDIGAIHEVTCTIDAHRSTGAEVLTGLVQKPLLGRLPQVYWSDAGVVSGLPYLSLGELYVTGRVRDHLLKGTLVALPHRTVACTHDEPGYVRSLRDVALELAQKLVPVEPEPSPRFHAVSVQRVNETSVGFVETLAYDTARGSSELTYTSILGRSPGALVEPFDAAQMTKVDGAGEISSIDYEQKLGERKGRVSLVRTEATTYAAVSDGKGDTVLSPFTTQAPLLGSRGVAAKLLAGAHSGSSPFSLEVWTPRSYKTATVTRYQQADDCKPSAPHYRAHVDDGETELRLDGKGLVEHALFKTGANSVETTRAFVHGSP
jgi:hypothetical protein